MTVAIMAAMLSDLPYIEEDTTEHAQEWNFVVHRALWSDNFASFVPKVASQRGLLVQARMRCSWNRLAVAESGYSGSNQHWTHIQFIP